jgi:hypothetical protein
MAAQPNLSFKLIKDNAGSGMSIGYLYSVSDKFTLTQQHAPTLWKLMSLTAKQKSCVVVWFGEEGASCSIAGARRVLPPNDLKQRGDSVFWKGFGGEDEFVADLAAIWNAFKAVQIYPTEFGEQLPDIVSSHFFDRRDEKRRGMDYLGRDRPTLDDSRGIFSSLRSTMRPVWVFLRSMTSSEFREDLMSPLRSLRDAEVVKQLGLFIRKGGGDCLEVLTTSANIGDSVRAIFAQDGIACSFANEQRKKWS